MSFDSFGLSAEVLRGVRDLGYTEPTPIQRDAIPPAREGRDVLACAMTGSGKTAAFVLPILERLRAKPRGAVRALVLSPTRELAAQIQEQFAALGKHTPVRSAAVHGGVGMGPQEDALRRGADVIVACPGRLLDHMQHPYARFDRLEVLVLDEADRMLDMGFLPDVRRVIARLPSGGRQTLLFSATMPAPIVSLSRELLRDPVAINIERKAAPATGIAQAIYPCPQERKTALFLELLKRPEVRSVLVFTRTKHRANRLADFLARHGVSSDRIHGNRSQGQRTQALEGFKGGRTRVLVATDIAARGIDIDDLSHVVNFDVPVQPEDYIHRAGRTARAGATGDAITFAAPEEAEELRAIERAVGARLPRVTVPGFDYEARAAERFEVPIAERIAAIRARKAEERARAKEKAARRAAREAGHTHVPPAARPQPHAHERPHAHGRAPEKGRAAGHGLGHGHGLGEGQRRTSPEESAAPAPERPVTFVPIGGLNANVRRPISGRGGRRFGRR
jgi:ATP-dependent RNA helicase RhlE